MSRKYKFRNKSGAYFVSFATVYWIDVFTRQCYFSVLAEGINYCRKQKGMEVFAYCFMPSHVHLVLRSAVDDPSGLLRDFKKFTSKQIIKAIKENPRESRKKWMLWMFEKAGRKKSNVSKYQFWQHHNHPIELWSKKVIKQKVDYIHNNPVKAGFVTQSGAWKYSSARNFAGDIAVIQIDDIGFLG